MASVTLKNLVKTFKNVYAVNDVSLEIRDKEFLVLVGPSGCGKTTLLKCINRTIDFIPTARVQGPVLLDGEDVFRLRNVYALRRRIGMVFPLPVGLPLSVYENVAYGPRRAGIHERAELDEIVETCLRQAMLWDEVKDRLSQQASTLSGGQQQRLCLARALALRPEILLLDEPTASLDFKAAQRIEDLLIELKSRYTLVIVSHSLSQAQRLAESLFVLHHGGRIEALGKDVFQDRDALFAVMNELI